MHFSALFFGIEAGRGLQIGQFLIYTRLLILLLESPIMISGGGSQKKKIDNYTVYLDRKLGEGSFGKVYIG